MTLGKMDRQIVVERRTVVLDDYGGEVETWAEICRPWAQIAYGTGSERRVAAQESAVQSASFRIRANPITAGIGAVDRIAFDGGYWDIAGNVPFQRDRRDITATRSA